MTRWIDLSHGAFSASRSRTLDSDGPGELGGVLIAENPANLQKVAGRKLTIGAFP